MSSTSGAKTASTATFVTALVFNAAVFAIELAIFTIIRPYFKSIYEPRTYVPPASKRAKPLSPSRFGWPLAVYRADYRAIISANGLDAYFFVRFLRVMAITFLPIWLVSWAILLPITAVQTHVAGRSGLDKFSFGNVDTQKQVRYAAHLILVYGFTFWIFYVIRREMHHFILTRQQYLVEHNHAKSVQANTILVTGVPTKYLTQDALYKLFNSLPGGVKKIWINRNLKELPDIYDRRLAACAKLESAETALLSTAAKLRLEAAKKGAKNSTPPDLEEAVVEVPKSERPTHRLGSIPFVGKKVDTIEWCREEIAVCTRLLDEGRAKIRENDERGPSDPPVDEDEFADAAVDAEGNPKLRTSLGQGSDEILDPSCSKIPSQAKGAVTSVAKGTVSGVAKGAHVIKERITGPHVGEDVYPPLSSAFVTFGSQIGAHLAVQVLAHHEPYRMSDRYIEVSPEDVIWANMGLNPYEQKIRIAISYAATAALIIFWAIPVAFVGVISNIYTVCTTVSWLAWICTLPKVVVGIISGILPPVLLAVLMMLLPIILRLLARFEGIPKYTGLELSLMTRFFIFQVIHGFLIVTLSSGIMASLEQLLKNPTSVPTILAQGLPGASIFFLTYIVLQGLTGVAAGFLQIVPLIIYYVKLFILGSTPRSVWSIKFGLQNVAWGTTFPMVTLLVVITLGYSIISPVINGFACATFFMYYQLYKYLFLYAYGQPSTTDTGGLFYPKALQHVFVGMYVQQVCLCALFFLARNSSGHASAVVEGALMVVLMIITAGYHIIINNSYDPLLVALPLSLQDKTYKPEEVEVSPTSPKSPKRTANASDSDIDVEAADEAVAEEAAAQEEEDSYGFAHPAASRPQRTVWIPKDTLGLTEEEERACKDAGVLVSHRNATMNEKGSVDVSAGPPDLIGEK